MSIHREHQPGLSTLVVKPIANFWRNRILVALHTRPMSPKEFADTFSGPKLPTISRYFRELQKWGFIEVAEQRRSGNRRGAAEKVYRALRKVHFDTPAWHVLPHYLRKEGTGVVLEGLFLRAAEALQAGTFDAEPAGHQSCDIFSLDHQAWITLTDRLDAVLYWLSELEAESKARLSNSLQRPLSVTVALLAFRSPPEDAPTLPLEPALKPVGPPGPHFLLNPQTAKAIADPWRDRILSELHLRPLSPRQFNEEIGGPDLSTTARHFRQLRGWGYIEVAEKQPGSRRGSAIKTIYRIINRSHLDLDKWEALPVPIKVQGSGAFLERLLARIKQSVTADTMDADTDRHLSWKSLSLDHQSWSECSTCLEGISKWVDELAAEFAQRLEVSDGWQISATVSLLSFHSPQLLLGGLGWTP